MIIYALDSENEEFQTLVNSLGQRVSIDLFEDFDSMFLALEDGCDGLLFDFDISQRKTEKYLKQIKKNYEEIPIFLLSNKLDPRKQGKHQKGKTGANIYFQTPLDEEMVDILLEPFLELSSGGAEALANQAEELINSHAESKKPVSANAEKISSQIDGALSAVFFEEYAEEDEIQAQAQSKNDSLGDIKLDQGENSGSDLSEDMDEITMDEETFDLAGGDDEVSLDTSDEDAIDLGSGDDWEENSDLSLDDEGPEPEVKLPNEEDLTFPDIGDFASEMDDSQPEVKAEADDELSLDGIDELAMDTDDEVSLESEEAGLDLGEIDELSLDDNVETVAPVEDDGIDFGKEEDLMDLSSDDSANAGSDELDFDIEVDEDISELSLSDDEEHTELSIKAEETSASQVMRLDDTSSDLDTTSEETNSMSLGSEAEESFAGEMNTGMNVISGLEDELNLSGDSELGEQSEITRPALGVELADLEPENEEIDFSVNASQGEFVEEGQDDIDDLLAQSPGEEEGISGVSLDETATSVGVENLSQAGDIVHVDKPLHEEMQDDNTSSEVTIVGLSMQTNTKQALHKDLKVDHATKAKNISEALEKQTSIAIESDLTSMELPSEVPSFSTTVVGKLDEIDNMLAAEEEEEFDEDATVVQKLNKETEIFNDQTVIQESQFDEDATMVQSNRSVQSSLADNEATRVFRVPENVVDDHRQYVQTHDEELIRLGETIKNLREDRQGLIDKIDRLEGKKDHFDRDFLAIKAEADERKIEIVVVKKRLEKQIEDMRFQLDMTLDKKEFLQRQNDELQAENETLSRQKKLDVSKIRSRERELEEKLEMLRRDAEIQMRNRDQKILELKRRIDTLEFDIESASMKEKKSVNSQVDLEDKMSRVIKTLRGAIGQLEDDYDFKRRKTKIKDNLDV